MKEGVGGRCPGVNVQSLRCEAIGLFATASVIDSRRTSVLPFGTVVSMPSASQSSLHDRAQRCCTVFVVCTKATDANTHRTTLSCRSRIVRCFHFTVASAEGASSERRKRYDTIRDAALTYARKLT